MESLDGSIGWAEYQSLSSYSPVPTSFDPDDAALRAFPRPLLWRWSSAEWALGAISPTIVMMRAPLFWQLEQPLWRAAQAHGAAIFVNDKDNMPLGRSAMASGADTIVTSAHDALAFSAYLKEKKVPFPRGWLVVHDIRERIDISDIHAGEATHIFQEAHLFPGMPAFVQCDVLAHTRSSLFHIPDGCTLSVHPRVAFSGPTDDPQPLIDIHIQISIKEKDTCSCGRMVYDIS